MCTVVALCLLYGCATPPQITPIRAGEPLAIVVVGRSPADGTIKIRNQALGDGITAGSSSGAIAGGLLGLGCGPLAIVCVPLAAMAGGATGLVAGAAVGVTGELSEEKSAQLRQRLRRLRESHDPLDELRDQITERARKHWRLTTDQTQALITIELQDLLLTSTRDERIGFVMRVMVTVRPSAAQQTQAPTQKLYEYVTPLSSLAIWLDERSDFLATSFSGAHQQIAAQIVAELATN